MSTSSLPSNIYNTTIWSRTSKEIWANTSFSLSRNIEGLRFPGKASEKDLLSIRKKLETAISALPLDVTFIHGEDISPDDIEYLHEHFLYEFDPSFSLTNQSFGIDASCQTLFHINGSDHLLIRSFSSSGMELDQLSLLFEYEKAIATSVKFAYSKTQGFYTSDVGISHTGLSVEAFIHTPALLHTRSLEHIQHAVGEEITIKSLSKSFDIPYDLLIVTNTHSLYATYEEILEKIHNSSSLISSLEFQARSILSTYQAKSIKSDILQAVTKIKKSKSLPTKDALHALSLLQLGTSFGWINGTTSKDISTFFFECRRAHMKSKSKTALTPTNIDISRAKYSKSFFSKIEMVV